MITDEYGNCLFATKEALDLIYSGESIDQMMLDDATETSRYNANATHFDLEQMLNLYRLISLQMNTTNCYQARGLFPKTIQTWISNFTCLVN